MLLYVLDTDCLSLFRQGHPALGARCAARSVEDLVTTAITVEEHLTGWYSLIRRARHPEQLEHAYLRLTQAVQFLGNLRILNYTASAVHRFEQLRALKLNVGKMDLRIAAITLEAGGILVSRNLRDFRRIPDLLVEDWTTPLPAANGNPPPSEANPE